MEAFGGGTEGGPPTGASFFEEEEFGTVLGADQAGGDDFGVIEYEKVSGGKEGGEIADGEVAHYSGCLVNMEKAGGVARVSGGGGDSVVGDSDGEKFL